MIKTFLILIHIIAGQGVAQQKTKFQQRYEELLQRARFVFRFLFDIFLIN